MRMGSLVLTAVVGGSLALAMAGPPPAGASSCSVPLYAYRLGTVTLSDGGRVARVHVQIADTPDRQQTGLMCRNALDPDAGMLFLFPTPTDGAFWMKNTLIPLAIAFINSNWRIVRIMEMPVAPDPTADDPGRFPLYDPHMPYRYVLEVNTGFFKTHGISEHAEVRFNQEGSFLPQSPTAIFVP
jgi:uncharacterized membrane protein (UPF0127 family)